MKEIIGQATSLAALVEYQEGSVVSRQVVKQKTGNVTLFAFAQGQELSEHTAPFDALVIVLEGEGEVIVSGKPMTLRAGDATLMPADEPHALKAHQRFKMLLVMIRS